MAQHEACLPDWQDRQDGPPASCRHEVPNSLHSEGRMTEKPAAPTPPPMLTETEQNVLEFIQRLQGIVNYMDQCTQESYFKINDNVHQLLTLLDDLENKLDSIFVAKLVGICTQSFCCKERIHTLAKAMGCAYLPDDSCMGNLNGCISPL